MKTKFLILFYVLFSALLTCQTAEFRADIKSLKKSTGNNERVYNEAMQMKWIINGKKLYFGSEPIRVIPNKRTIDTILFRHKSNSKYDTIICNIEEACKFSFEYNPCCGSFYLRKENKSKLSREVKFVISNKDENDLYLGTLGETGILLNKNNVENHINEICRSAMSPNVYPISICKIRKGCNLLNNCEELLCEIQNGEAKNGFEYEVIETQLEFLYLPLSEKTLEVLFDQKTKNVELRYF